VHLLKGDRDTAENHFAQAIEIACGQSAKMFELRTAVIEAVASAGSPSWLSQSDLAEQRIDLAGAIVVEAPNIPEMTTKIAVNAGLP